MQPGNLSQSFSLKPGQSQVLESLRNRQSIFTNLPTGYGKSLTYLLPVKEWNWRVWVVSPLVSLIEDQRIAAENMGIRAYSWNRKRVRGQSAKQRFDPEIYPLAFFSPELFVNLGGNGTLLSWANEGLLPDLIVIDELHCYDQWQGFRGAFKESLSFLFRHAKEIPVLGLSATLSLDEGKAWLREIGKDATGVSVGLGRENLALHVSPQLNQSELIINLVEQLKDLNSPDTALVYCRTRMETEWYSQYFRSLGFSAVAYHAGRSVSYKNELGHLFRVGKIPLMFATSAFGMGIDYGRVRKVIHLAPPPSISALWQEAGRAGRDGKPSDAIFYFRRSDLCVEKISSEKEKLDQYQVWRLLWQKECRKSYIARFFGMQEKKCNNCDWCNFSSVRSEQKIWWMENSRDLKHWVKKNFFCR